MDSKAFVRVQRFRFAVYALGPQGIWFGVESNFRDLEAETIHEPSTGREV